MQYTHRIPVREGVSVTALRTTPDEASTDVTVVYAPGAGSNLNDAFGTYLAQYLEARGVECWRFQFPYSEAGRKAPDPPALLEATWRAVIGAVGDTGLEEAQHPGLNRVASAGGRPQRPGLSPGVTEDGRRRLVIGGRSMGGRIASMVVAKGAAVDGLALFAYPLVPPGRASSDRAEHFERIGVPALFCSGTRDAFGTPEQLREAVARAPDAALHLLEGADHGFATLKSSGRTREDVWQEACEALMGFLGVMGDDRRSQTP